MLLITNYKFTSILICNVKVILIVRFSCRISKCEWNLKCESNHHSAMYYVMLLIIHFDITFIFTFKRVGNCVVDRHQNAFPTRSICKCEWNLKCECNNFQSFPESCCALEIWYHIQFQVQKHAIIVLFIDNKCVSNTQYRQVFSEITEVNNTSIGKYRR